MNNEIAIKINGLGKQYRIGHRQSSYSTLRDTISDSLTAPFRKVSQLIRGNSKQESGTIDLIWALQNISFEIKRGEVVGIIGGNGAGKSTLLKVLSRITEPSTGYADIYGRVGSLLEVGTGFHAELSSRENIFLNGAILGMKRVEIKRKFDEMVDFAEIDKFIDTPVKHYSSGMYMRLAFAVAAYLDPEILLVDEVLAVGDTRFQKKCLKKMEDIGQAGRTVLFVSHSMPSITRLCTRAILLEGGEVKAEGSAHSVVCSYMNSGTGISSTREWIDPKKAPGRDIARLRSVRVCNKENEVVDTVNVHQTFAVEMEFDVLTPGCTLMPYHHVYNEENINVFQAHETDIEWRGRERPIGRYRSRIWIPGNLLAEGMLYITSGVTRLNPIQDQFCERDAVVIQIIEEQDDAFSARGDWPNDMGGVVRPHFSWDTQFDPAPIDYSSKRNNSEGEASDGKIKGGHFG